jgi:hypothetical protein
MPMTAFCDPGADHADAWNHLVRFAFCKRDETLDDVIRRLAAFLQPTYGPAAELAGWDRALKYDPDRFSQPPVGRGQSSSRRGRPSDTNSSRAGCDNNICNIPSTNNSTGQRFQHVLGVFRDSVHYPRRCEDVT